jgi:tartrate dehydrogenase/decarboxylase/D-malate dehydrogenase
VSATTIAVIAGDGIGPEVVEPTVMVLEAMAALHGIELVFEAKPWGCDYFNDTGQMMPDDALSDLERCDAILLGAVGRPDVPDNVSLWGLLIPIRRAFEQYANVRPLRLFPGTDSPLRRIPDDFDLLVVRENTEGEYSQDGGRFKQGTADEYVLQQSVFTRRGCSRILTYAFDQASNRRGRLVVATKSNGLPHSMPFWDEVAVEVAQQFPDVNYQLMHVDALAAKFVLDPASLDVVVGTNLFGDILSDLGAALTGGLGVAPSANLNPERRYPSMFEPVHGSAPDIAGKGVANPVAQLWSASLMLDHLGHAGPAKQLLDALVTVTGSPQTRTPDLNGTASTSQVTEAVLSHLGVG